MIPKHVGIIMDGNGRWATNRGLKRSEGHKEGAKVLENIALYAKELGIDILSVYAFSTDNFKRSKEEVDYLMDLLVHYFNYKFKKVMKDDIKIIISGSKDNLRDDVIKAIDNIENKTKNNKACILNICLNYGGQEEIVNATKKICEKVINENYDLDNLNRSNYYEFLYQNLPPLDLLIRTGREKRLSNFMLYQAFYTEIFFDDILFPDYKKQDLERAIKFYEERDRRFGGIKQVEKK